MSTGVRTGGLAMAIDHPASAPVHRDPPYRHLRPGQFVIVGAAGPATTSWWMGQVVCCEGSEVDRSFRSICQLTDVESGQQRQIQAGEVSEVIWALDGWPDGRSRS